uniref:Retrotransposon protein-like n=1 Tax=Oryza rufipogon TaxID=4529 RepID=A0A679BBW0_ORYRU|nr:retrotransposon protein-like [Oryza rufipogon]
MARGSAPLDGSVLPPSRIVSERQAGLPRRFMPESATGREVVELGEGRPAPHYPGRSVFFLSFTMAGLVPPFSSFFMDVLELYDLQMAHLTPNAVMTLAIFAHLCEMFIGVRPSLRLFRWFFTVQPVSPPSVVGGCYFQPRGPVLSRYIPCVLRKKWDDWKSDWFYTPLTDEARLRLPRQPPAQASCWRAPVDLGDGYDAVLDRLAGLRSQGLTGAMVYGDYLRRRIAPLQRRARGAWEYTGPEDYMRTHQGSRWDWAPEDFKMVVQRVLYLSSVEASLIPQGVLPLCSDPDRANILTIMQAVGASEERAPRGHDGAGGSRRGEQSTPGGGRASGPRDGGPGGSRPADARGKRKLEGTPSPSPPRGDGAVRASSRRSESAVPTPQPEGERRKKRLHKMGGPSHAGGTSSRPRGGRLADLPAGSFLLTCFFFVFWFSFCFSEIPSRPPRHSKSGRSEAEETATAEARRREADRREAADRLREAEEAAQEAVRVRQAEETAREEARLRRAEESVREEEAARARQAACQAPDSTPPEATTTSEATHDKAADAPLGPDPSGDAWDEPASGDAPGSGTSIGGPSRAAPTPRRLSPLPSAAPLSAEPLLQALAAANTTVLDGLSAQMEVLRAERAELDAAWAHVEEGRRSVEAMVEAGRKAHRRHASELEARLRELAEIAREVEEERETALIATAVLDEVRDDLRLQYGSRAAELEKKLDAARGILDAAAARERRAAENEAASRRREEALEARATALEERARAKERDLADREAAVAIREATLAAHEAACAEEESALRLREDALTEQERALEEAEAAAQRLADSLFLCETAREEQARRNLEGARAERAALDQRAAELEARAKELDARAHSGGAAAGDGDLAARLAAAEHTIAGLQDALDSSAGEVEALRLANERLPEEFEETIKSSSRDLARGAVELVLASYQARDPDFSPWAALDEFPPGTEDGARARVRDAADHIVHSFEGTAPRLAFALDSDEEGDDGGADDSDDEAGDPGASE